MSLAISLAIAGLFAVAVAIIAAGKGRSPLAWFAIGLVIPLFGLVAIVALEPAPSHERPAFSKPGA